MNVEIGMATDVAEQAIIVSELEKLGPSTDDGHEHVENCANCGAHLQGAFCHQCGQSAHIHHSLLHLVEELLHGLFHFETKAWRTIPALIFQPGKLTRNYIDGQRTKYVSPLALFLFLIFLMFFVFSLTNPFNQTAGEPQAYEGISKAIGGSQAKLASLQAQRQKLSDNAPEMKAIDKAIEDTKVEISALENSRLLIAGKDNQKINLDDSDGINKLARELENSQGHSDFPALQEKIRHAIKKPELTLYKLKGNASKLAFLLMPISLPFLWLMFIFKRQFGMFDHAVFSLYSLSFMAVLVIITSVLATLNFSSLATFLFVLTPPIHMFVQLRSSYGLGVGASLWRTICLLFIALCSLIIYILLIIGMSM